MWETLVDIIRYISDENKIVTFSIVILFVTLLDYFERQEKKRKREREQYLTNLKGKVRNGSFKK